MQLCQMKDWGEGGGRVSGVVCLSSYTIFDLAQTGDYIKYNFIGCDKSTNRGCNKECWVKMLLP
jgi:hypothetical protein